MKHEQQLASVRRWFSKNKDWIRLTALAHRLEVGHSTLARALTEDVEQQRNVSPEFLKQIVQTLTDCNFNSKVDYAKGN
jgi:hypothetical protein